MELSLDDLAEKCAECNGTGERSEEASRTSGQSYGVSPVVSYQVDRFCPRCAGSGRTKLTEAGRAILELTIALKKNPMLSK